MRNRKTTATLAAILSLAMSPASAHDGDHEPTAQVCNKTGRAVFAAIGYRDGGEWYSEGWFEVHASECRDILPDVSGPIFFVVLDGETVGDALTWVPDEGFPTRKFCVDWSTDDDFVYAEDDCDEDEEDTVRVKFGRVVDDDGDGIARFNVRRHHHH